VLGVSEESALVPLALEELLAAAVCVEVVVELAGVVELPGATYFFALPPIGTPKNNINRKIVHIHRQQAIILNLLLFLLYFFSIDFNSFFAFN
jgi:hypothetical protein